MSPPSRPTSRIDSESPHIAFSEGYIAGRRGDYAAAEALLRPLRQRMMARRLTSDPGTAHRYTYIDCALALVEVRQGRKAFAQEVLRRYASVASRPLDDLGMRN